MKNFFISITMLLCLMGCATLQDFASDYYLNRTITSETEGENLTLQDALFSAMVIAYPNLTEDEINLKLASEYQKHEGEIKQTMQEVDKVINQINAFDTLVTVLVTILNE